ncbi:MAG: nucleotide exchange factor GrpE [Thermoleophilia bacterium]|jgi:molecular chaperone GrpE
MSTKKRKIPINEAGSEPAVGPDTTDPATEAGVDAETTVEGIAYGEDVAGAPDEASAADKPTDATATSEKTGSVSADDLIAERDRLDNALLRLRAEFDNFRKRSARELIESRECAQGDLLCELLPVLDNLERALDAAEHHEEGKVLDGVRMTRDMFVDLLRRVGAEEIETVGAAFDPVVHEAMVSQPSSEDEGTVTTVLERGYRQGDRVLRPARVVVSSGTRETDNAETAG